MSPTINEYQSNIGSIYGVPMDRVNTRYHNGYPGNPQKQGMSEMLMWKMGNGRGRSAIGSKGTSHRNDYMNGVALANLSDSGMENNGIVGLRKIGDSYGVDSNLRRTGEVQQTSKNLNAKK